MAFRCLPVSQGDTKKLFSFCYSRRQFVFFILTDCKMIRLLLFQLIKEKIHRILERFVILSNLHGVEHFKKCCEILLFHRCLIVNVADQCRVKQFFRL